MALGEMKTKSGTYSAAPEILYNADYVGKAVTLDTAAFSNGICKAGTPIGKGGVIANTESAMGVLLHDVYEDRPQGTVVIYGYIHTERAEQHSGITIVETAKTAMKNVVFC